MNLNKSLVLYLFNHYFFIICAASNVFILFVFIFCFLFVCYYYLCRELELIRIFDRWTFSCSFYISFDDMLWNECLRFLFGGDFLAITFYLSGKILSYIIGNLKNWAKLNFAQCQPRKHQPQTNTYQTVTLRTKPSRKIGDFASCFLRYRIFDAIS